MNPVRPCPLSVSTTTSVHGYGKLKPSFCLQGGGLKHDTVFLNFSHRIRAVKMPSRLAILALDLEEFRSWDV